MHTIEVWELQNDSAQKALIKGEQKMTVYIYI